MFTLLKMLRFTGPLSRYESHCTQTAVLLHHISSSRLVFVTFNLPYPLPENCPFLIYYLCEQTMMTQCQTINIIQDVSNIIMESSIY
jgi:hypothetical protein